MNGRARSNLELIQKELGHGIWGDIQFTDRSGQESTIYALRATIRFLDGSVLYVTEYTNKFGIIDRYYYDWTAADWRIKAQYHSEPHKRDQRYQTATEPYHIHPPQNTVLSNLDRFPNYAHQDLYSIVEGIIIFAVIPSRTSLE
ncbi:toxin-antitoxin system TumE family protein [Cohnella cellulosilytica]|uniref:DUF6516 family protein n=1 Tax=Cohnella cellulosilytica TaxID=986710 RepID=A0ABW2F5P4_9BACL